MNPTVTCVMLTSDRHELAARAVEAFHRQTYENRALVIFDSGENRFEVQTTNRIAYSRARMFRVAPIGQLRNTANESVAADIIMHWDDDDWSHPNRIAEQVALLQASQADVVGYNEMLFARLMPTGGDVLGGQGWLHEAWLYKHPSPTYALGTSLCYWRRIWEAKQFDPRLGARGTGEDSQWLMGLKVQAISAVHVKVDPDAPAMPITPSESDELKIRMIARIHKSNHNLAYYEELLAKGNMLKRVPEWDARVREILA